MDKNKQEILKTPGVELIPEEIRKEFEPKKKILILLLSIFLFVFILILGPLSIKNYQKSKEYKLKEIQAKIEKINQEINNSKEKKEEVMFLQAQLLQVNNLLDSHIYWTKLFSILEKLTIDTVYYKSITASINGKIDLSAQGEGYLSVGRQLLAFQEAKEVEKVNIKAASKNEEGKTDFKIELLFKKDAFLKE